MRAPENEPNPDDLPLLDRLLAGSTPCPMASPSTPSTRISGGAPVPINRPYVRTVRYKPTSETAALA